MKIFEEKNMVVIDEVTDFVLDHIFDCGQCFRWEKETDGSYTGVAGGQLLNIRQEGPTVFLDLTDRKTYEHYWKHYFDMDRDYAHIKEVLSAKDEMVAEAIRFGHGLRVLNQDAFEILITFIVSARNSIPMIRHTIAFLSEQLGHPVGEYRGKIYYAFPTPKSLAQADYKLLQEAKSAFRASYIKDSSSIQASGETDIYKLKNLPTEMAKRELMLFPGVGPKVADCVLLFGLCKQDVFPVDRWIKRVMEKSYMKQEVSDLRKIRNYALHHFGSLSGFAQQYLFYYVMEHRAKEE